MSEQAMTTSGGSHHHPTPQAPRLSSFVPSPYFLLAMLILTAILLGLAFASWLEDETRKPPLNPDEGEQRVAVFRPNPPECDDAPDLYDCLNTPVN